mmetsp:Transcript_17974/g.45348  ORF Transcript_17974/g.45348 Transcript_17974/m.45348 type:complete len:280 (-) Transcript_17974:217-1056(-)
MQTKALVLGVVGSAAMASAFTPAPVVGRPARASAVSALQMAQAPPPTKLPRNKAQENCVAANKEQWGITEPIKAGAGGAAPAPKKAAAAPAKKKAAAAPAANAGFSGVPSDYARPGQTAFGSEGDQTVLGMRGPRADGHRDKFGSRHAAVSLACAALLWQPISQAGMYTIQPGGVQKDSFDRLEVEGFGETKKVPSISALFPFERNGFDASGTLFGPNSRIVFDNPLNTCGAYKSGCHTFLDEMGEMLEGKNYKPDVPRSEGKATYSFPWMYDHASWQK